MQVLLPSSRGSFDSSMCRRRSAGDIEASLSRPWLMNPLGMVLIRVMCQKLHGAGALAEKRDSRNDLLDPSDVEMALGTSKVQE